MKTRRPAMKKRRSMILALFTALVLFMTMSVSVFAGTISSNDAALKTALKNAKLKNPR